MQTREFYDMASNVSTTIATMRAVQRLKETLEDAGISVAADTSERDKMLYCAIMNYIELVVLDENDNRH